MEKLPRQHVVFNVPNLTIESAFIELNKAVYYSEDENWDGAYYWIKKKDNTFASHCEMYVFAIAEDRLLHNADAVEYELNITSEIQVIFNFIQNYYASINPACPFDTLFITVQKDGRYIVNYEFNDEEVQPNVEPIPEDMTAEYIVQNLFGCITANVPDNFVWVWEILERKKNHDGNVSIGAEFRYSLNEDQSDEQLLIPGEYVYMYNVSEKLFDEFFQEMTQNWSKIKLLFKVDGSVKIKVLEKKFD